MILLLLALLLLFIFPRHEHDTLIPICPLPLLLVNKFLMFSLNRHLLYRGQLIPIMVLTQIEFIIPLPIILAIIILEML